MNPEYAKMTKLDYIHDQVKKETERLVVNGGKVVDKVSETGRVIEKGKPTGLTYKTAKRVARQRVVKSLGYNAGKLGQSEVAGLASRKERRQSARDNKETFLPQYNGSKPQTFEEFNGVGYERFNNKFVTIKEV
jgi:hypothetical protein